MKQYIFRVLREKVDGQTVRITLEPYAHDQVVQVDEGAEFITGMLNVDPWKEN